ncbi:hypothetical protein N0V93_008804 [Gnomoniopsis smithogilvyi]|uniref:Polyketide synthase n=1 Tax=Gnomoniopsis smithogilvyi TaxID=1191159 RepID=A0A9W8YQY2_9PEZI|nr:hypothetical protein N0V93_008804 [Gnomoniopsis smithogilvyi]
MDVQNAQFDPRHAVQNLNIDQKTLVEFFETEIDDAFTSAPSSSAENEPFTPKPSPIAICGMACRLPGGLEDPKEFWQFLLDKKEALCRVPADRFNVDSFHSVVKGNPGTTIMDSGYFLQEIDLKKFDPSFYSMSRREIERMDPQHRLLLEVSRECLESAGETEWRGTKTGCFVGTFGQDWGDIQSADRHTSGLYNVTGQGDFLLANRVSYEYDLKGPSFTVKTACSSSMIALHLACTALKNGECDAAIVGGTNLITAPAMSIVMTDQGIVSPEGRCKTFDASADGYGRGEAISAIYLKRLDDAVRDNNPVRAVIRATGTNSDGKSASLASPSSEAHEALIRATYTNSGLDPRFADVPFVECHGTGTAVGDPLEATAIANVFGNNQTYIGSVKPNVGHSEGASGLTSIIKCVMALENKTIPPNINFHKPNPKIPFDTTQLAVPVEPIPWPVNRAERVSVNSFGMGGANAHAIIESAETWGVSSRHIAKIPSSEIPQSQLIILSANRAESLAAMIEKHSDYIKQHKSSLDDIAYTLALRREHLRYRAFAVLGDGKGVELKPEFKTKTIVLADGGKPPNITFVFTGQGAQWPEMGKEIIHSYPSVSSLLDRMDATLGKLCASREWTIRDELIKPASKTRIDKAEFSQPLCTALQICLVSLLKELGVLPDCVVGHSSGEIAAAYAAGAIDVEDAILIAYMRGQATKSQTQSGAMAAVGRGAAWVRQLLPDGVVVACENSGSSTTVSGDSDAVNAFIEKVKERDAEVFVRHLRVEQAYHSLTGKKLSPTDRLDASYWQSNLESPVLFHGACLDLLSEMGSDNRIFLEVGPHGALAGPLRQIFKDVAVSPTYISTLSRREDSRNSFLQAAGELWANGASIQFTPICRRPGSSVIIDLPHYPWHRGEQYWEESRVAQNWRMRKHLPHDLLGTPVLESHPFHPTWRRILRLEDAPWLRGHRIKSNTIFPAAGYISMAGEATRELTGIEDYCLKDVTISTALVLDDSRSVELLTVLRKERLTDSLEGEYYDFDISSYNGRTWTKHCWGKVKPGRPVDIPSQVDFPDLKREVSGNRWYKAMLKMGLNYTGPFQRLQDIFADPASHRATARIPAGVPVPFSESFYTLHPSSIDLIFQLLTVSIVQGQARLLTTLSVPTFIGEIYIGGGDESGLHLIADAKETAGGTFCGEALGIGVGNLTMFRLKGLQTSRLDTGDEVEKDPHAAVQMDWKPHFDFVDPAKLIVPHFNYEALVVSLERLMYLSVIDALERVQGATKTQPHYEKLCQWMEIFVEAAKAGSNKLLPDAPELAKLQPGPRVELIESLFGHLTTTAAKFAAIGINRNRLALREIFEGTTEPLDVLMEDLALHKMYEFLSFWEYDDYFKLMAHKTPTLRILEIGAGTGGTTAAVLPTLRSEFGERLYAKYTYTDISAGFFRDASTKFANFEAMEYKVLDISKDPISQGFEPESYDLIIAANCLHATPSLLETLTNVRKLLHPQGRLFIQELAPVTRWFNFIVGTLPGWWLGENDDRRLEPYVMPERWDKELKAAGFGGVDAVVFDHQQPYQMNANLLASPAERFVALTSKAVTFLHKGTSGSPVQELAAAFVERGVEVHWHNLMDADVASLPKDQDIISVLELDDPFIDEISGLEFEKLMETIRSLKAKDCVLWLTHAAQMDCKDPRFAKVIGLARNVRSELGIDIATVELDTTEAESGVFNVVYQLWEVFARREHDAVIHPDFEYAIRNNVPHIPRFHWISVAGELADSENFDSQNAMLVVGKRGFLNTLHWEKRVLAPIGDDEVRVRTCASALNFKDVLTAMNIVVETTLGYESAGIVEDIGKNVTNLEVGDRALVFAEDCLATYATGKAAVASKIPDNVSFTEACTMPVVYLTAIRGLIDLGRLQKGQSVLIHSACGGVGIAAIHLSKMVGANIFCTVGSQEKREYLISHMGIPNDHIFDSRSESFHPAVMKATHGRGVDIVLNSLSGALLHASWSCVAKFGSLIEIGKRDLLGHGKLDLKPFLDNRSYMCVDLHQLGVHRLDIAHGLWRLMMQYLEDGHIQPIRPIQAFPAEDVEAAFRYMQKGAHIGKIVIEFPEQADALVSAKHSHELRFKPDKSILLTGGFGGLGRATARWLVTRGAKHLAFMSRSGRNTDNGRFLAELEASGCSVQVFQGSVEDPETVKNVIIQLEKPLAGVLHLAMKLKDAWVRELTYEDWQEVQGPRVRGAWNVHNALLETKTNVDFFVMYGSFSGLVGNWGQANYSASNTFMDAFAQYRRGLGLPATTIDIGVVEDVGYVSESPRVLEYFKAVDALLLTEQSVLDAVELAIRRCGVPLKDGQDSLSEGYVNPASFGLGLRSYKSMHDASNRLIWRQDRRFCIARNMEKIDTAAQSSPTSGGIAAFMNRIEVDPSILDDESAVDFLARETGRVLFAFLLRPEKEIVLDKTLAAIGVDSLVSIEIRNWCRQRLRLELSVLEIMSS